MEKQIAELRRRISIAPMDRRGRRRYGSELRRDLVAMANAWRDTSSPQRALAEKLGVSEQTLATWLYPSGKKKRPMSAAKPPLKRVAVIDEAPGSDRGAAFVLTSGARIEGLDWTQVLALARELG